MSGSCSPTSYRRHFGHWFLLIEAMALSGCVSMHAAQNVDSPYTTIPGNAS